MKIETEHQFVEMEEWRQDYLALILYEGVMKHREDELVAKSCNSQLEKLKNEQGGEEMGRLKEYVGHYENDEYIRVAKASSKEEAEEISGAVQTLSHNLASFGIAMEPK